VYVVCAVCVSVSELYVCVLHMCFCITVIIIINNIIKYVIIIVLIIIISVY